MRAVVLVVLMGCAGDDRIDSGDTGEVVLQPFEPPPTCDYVDLDRYLVSCGGAWEELVRYADPSGAQGCPDYFGLPDDAWVTAASAIAAHGCDPTCVYRPESAVMFLHCALRSEFFVYVQGGPGQQGEPRECPDILYFESANGSGWYDSLEAFQADNACP